MMRPLLLTQANERLSKVLKLPAGTWQRTAVQLAFDQLINAPIVIAGFFASFQLTSALIGPGWVGLGAVAAAIAEQLQASWWSTVLSNWKIWVLPQLINFAFIPPFARVAFANCVALVWNVVLSVAANK